jgi:dihydrofolate reductase
MRKLLLQVQLSVDGYMADSQGKTDWMVWNWGEDWAWDDALRTYHTELTASVDCILLSRKMAEGGFIQHWVQMAEKQDNPQAGFAQKIADAQKVVFTNTLTTSAWEKTVLAKGNLSEEVTALKQTPGRNLMAYGGVAFAAALIQAGLVDEFHLILNPCALGSGLALFPERRPPLPLSLMKATPYPCGIVVAQFLSQP